MIARIKKFLEFLWLWFKGFRPVEFVRGNDRVSLHAFGWRANGSGRMKRAKDAVAYLDAAPEEHWKQIYCGMTPFLVSDKGNVKHIDGKPAKLFLSNGRYQLLYKPEDPRGRGKNGRDHKKRVYRSMLVAMAFLDFKKGDDTREIHHVNGYRTDDRLANLLVLSHEDHTRIHNMGPCALSGTRDEALAMLANAAPLVGDDDAGKNASESAEKQEPEAETKPADGEMPKANDGAEPAKKRRRGKRGGRKHRKTVDAAAPASTELSAEANAAPELPTEANTVASATAESGTAVENRTTDPAPFELSNTEAQSEAGSTTSAEPQAAPDAKREKKANNCRVESESDTANLKPTEESGPNKENKPESEKKQQPVDWQDARSNLEAQLSAYLEKCTPNTAKTPSSKQLTQWGKPVYKAYKPFLTCPDAVTQFDATLSCIRMIARAEAEWGKAGPAQLQSLLGTLFGPLKNAVKTLSAEDELVRSCVEELLREEIAKPEHNKTSTARKLSQCLSIARSHAQEDAESDSGANNPCGTS